MTLESQGSKARLTPFHHGRFPTESLADRLGRAVCDASCLPRKELHETWEFARRIRRRVRGGRIIDLCSGHGLLAWTLLLLDDSSPSAVCVDRRKPPSHQRLRAVLEERWPRLRDRVAYVEDDIDRVPLFPEDLVVSAHGCGGLTDRVLDRALRAGCPVAVLPCCHSTDKNDAGGLMGWMDPSLAIDVTRAARLRSAGYEVFTSLVPVHLTPKNRVLIGLPSPSITSPVDIPPHKPDGG